MVEPLAGWRHVAVTEHRTKQDYAECLRYLVEERYPEAERIYLVQDNLNTHTAGALYETFPQRKPGIFWTGCSSFPRPSTAVGPVKPRLSSVSSSAPVSRGPCRTKRPYSNGRRPWRRSATSGMLPLSGSSPHARPVSSSSTSIPRSSNNSG